MPQAQPQMMKVPASVQQQQQQQQDEQQQQLQMLCSRKNSLPHSSNLINNNNNNTNSSSDLNVNGMNKKLSGSSTAAAAVSTTTTTAHDSGLHQNGNNHQGMDVQQQQQQQQQQQLSSKTQSMKCPVVASPHQVMMLYMNKLTPYEHHEIYKYSHIYFIGANAKKRSGTGPNDYDNENGSYIHIPHDHIAYRYEVLKIIGKGMSHSFK
jgi:hypothetical protein